MHQPETKKRRFFIKFLTAAVLVVNLLLAAVVIYDRSYNRDYTQLQPQPEAPSALSYDVYWNIDRAVHEGQSDDGLSSRMADDNGFYHIRFFKDGVIEELKTDDYDLVNLIDDDYLMGLLFNDKGIITEKIPIEQMPYDKTAWTYYIDSFTGNALRCNSSRTMRGKNAMLSIADTTQIYDMTGMSGAYDAPVDLTVMDRIFALTDEQGQLAYIFVYYRGEFMLTNEAACSHCRKTVQWKEWTKDNQLPYESGHYILQKDINLQKQQNIDASASICLDLNGKNVTTAENKRAYAVSNKDAVLAVMDNSEQRSGGIYAYGNGGDQGLCVWVSKGEFHLYSGKLDASNAVSNLSGAAAAAETDTAFYMHGGEIIGGCSMPSDKDTKYTTGTGGAVYIGKNAVFEMNGGTISGGTSSSFGGNIYLQRGAVANLFGGSVYDGATDGEGGNIYISSGATLNVYSSSIYNGHSLENGGNISLGENAVFNLYSGEISDGCSEKNGGNAYISESAEFNMHGGALRGGAAAEDGGSIFTAGLLLISDNLADDTECIIDGGTAEGRGGAVAAAGPNAVVDMSGGTIQNGRAGSEGGNIFLYNDAVFNMRKGTVTDGMLTENGTDIPSESGNIFIRNAALNLYGGIINGDIADYYRSSITVNGTPLIEKGLVGGITLNSRKGVITCEALLGKSGSVCISTEPGRVFAVGADIADKDIFYSDNGYIVDRTEKGLCFSE